MKSLTAEQIFRADDLSGLFPVDVPEWGGTVYVGKITCGEQERLWALNERDKRKGESSEGLSRARYVAIVARNEKGERLFADPLADDMQARILAGKSDGAVERVYLAAIDFNHGGAAGAKDLKKNSAATNDSPSK